MSLAKAIIIIIIIIIISYRCYQCHFDPRTLRPGSKPWSQTTFLGAEARCGNGPVKQTFMEIVQVGKACVPVLGRAVMKCGKGPVNETFMDIVQASDACVPVLGRGMMAVVA